MQSVLPSLLMVKCWLLVVLTVLLRFVARGGVGGVDRVGGFGDDVVVGCGLSVSILPHPNFNPFIKFPS